jgi:hypothetical protein
MYLLCTKIRISKYDKKLDKILEKSYSDAELHHIFTHLYNELKYIQKYNYTRPIKTEQKINNLIEIVSIHKERLKDK